MSNSRRDFRFRFTPLCSSPDVILFEFIKAHQMGNDWILKALRAFWLADAYRDSGKKGQELKRLGMSMIIVLENQINHIKAICGVDYPPSSTLIYQQVSPQPENSKTAPSGGDAWDAIETVDTGGL